MRKRVLTIVSILGFVLAGNGVLAHPSIPLPPPPPIPTPNANIVCLPVPVGYSIAFVKTPHR